MDAWQTLDEERSALADDLAALTDSQWDAQSLCSEWKVRHVVGHLIYGATMTTGPVLTGFLKNGLSFNRLMAREGLALGASPPGELLRQFRKTIGMRHTFPGARPEILLIDLVCHGADIRLPAGLSRTVPEATLVALADMVKDLSFPLYGRKRIAGLRLSATDADWATGDGAPVEGPLESLILVMTGRKAPIEDPSGAGTPTLCTRT